MVLGFGHSWLALWVLPLGFVVGLTFGAFGLVMNSLAPSYDFFTYFFTLVLTPMLLLSGRLLPGRADAGTRCAASPRSLPLSSTRSTSRARCSPGRVPDDILLHLAVLLAYAVAAYYVALVLTRRRLLAEVERRCSGSSRCTSCSWSPGSRACSTCRGCSSITRWPTDPIGIERFKVMERKLYCGIMTPGAVLTIVFGLWLWLGYGITGGWLYAKLALVADPDRAPRLARQADARLRGTTATGTATCSIAGSTRFPRCRSWSASCCSSC